MGRRMLVGGLVPLLIAGCDGGSSRRGFTAPAVSSPAPAASTAPAASSQPPPPAISSRIRDSGLVPTAPGDATWYHRRDDESTSDNEAARDLARQIAVASNGLDEGLVYEHLTRGGGFAIFVGGNNHERDDPPAKESGWARSWAEHVQRDLGFPALQVDYDCWASGGAVGGPLGGPVDLATYHASHKEGVLRTVALILKAISAGAGEVRVYGHSKGGDVVQEAVWLTQSEPRLTMGLALGMPIWSAARPPIDTSGQFRMSGLFRPGSWNGRDWGGKLVVFVRLSDRATHGELWPPSTFPGPGHDYEQNLKDAGLRQAIEDARWVHPAGWEDRSLGRTYDW